MDFTIDISGLDKALVLAGLYNGARTQGLGFLKNNDDVMTVEQAQAIIDGGQLYFDYYNGRVMKVNLTEDSFDSWGYDRDNGEGAAFMIIRILRETGDPNAEAIVNLRTHGTIIAASQLQNTSGDALHELAKDKARPYAS